MTPGFDNNAELAKKLGMLEAGALTSSAVDLTGAGLGGISDIDGMEGKSGPASAAAGAAAGVASSAFEPGSSATVTAGAAAAGEGVFGGWPNVKDGAGLGLTAAEAAEGFVSENGRA